MKIKVCGLKYPDNIEDVSKLNINYMGFIFYPYSKRYFKSNFECLKNVNDKIKKVAVFVDEKIEVVNEIYLKNNFDYVQLHGNEDAGYCGKLNKIGVNIIKAFGIDETFDFNILNEYSEYVKYFLFDTKSCDYGGTGVKFNWNILNDKDIKTPFFLSGGIEINDIDLIKKLKIENLYGIDINSKFEIKPGYKDINMINKFINEL